MHKRTIYGLSIAILLTVLVPVIGITAYYPQDYTHQDSNVNSDIAYQMKPSEIVELYPMAEEEIKAIVHVAPKCPVIVDGILYEGKEICLFNGQRLHFTTDKKGNLYAFTDAVKMEELLEKEYGYTFELPATSSKEVSLLYMNWLFVNPYLTCSPGQQFLTLDGLWDNSISSAQIGPDASVTLWDYPGLTGDSITLYAGLNYSALTFQGFNDRASSIS